MAGGTKVRGITIELGADTSGISKALGSLNSEISKTSKELKDVEKLLKLDPGNTELLAQKQRLLTKAITESEQKVEALKEAQSQVNTETEEGRRQYDAIQREIVACTQEQAKWKGQLDTIPGTMEKIAATASKISTVTGELAEKTANVSKIAGSVLVGAAGMAYKAGQSADEINTLAKQYGVATDQIQKFNYAQELVDVSTDTMLSSMAKLTRQIGSGNKAFDELGVAIKDSNGEFRSTEDVWYDTLAALSQVENETERDILAQELFGKSAADLAGIIDDGGEALKRLGEEAEDAGLILSSDALQSANDFNDALDQLKATAGQAFMEAGTTLATTLLPHLERLAEAISNVLKWFGDMDADTQTLILTIVGFVAALSPVLSIISTISGAVAGLSTAIGFLSGPIGIAVLAFGALVAAGIALWQNWDTVKQKAGELKEKVVEKFQEVENAIKELPEKALQWGKDMVDGFIKGIGEKLGELKKAASEMAGAIADRLHFSHPDIGPLADFDTWMPDMMQQLAEGIRDNNWRVEEAVGGVAGTIAQQYNPDYAPITGRLDSLIGATAAAGGNSNVTVVLQGDAAGIFKVVRTENNKFAKSTGRSAF